MLALILVTLVQADEINHIYEMDEPVVLWFNKVVPKNSPQESYAFHKLPLCTGESPAPEHLYSLSLGEALEGHELTDSKMDIRFLQNIKEEHYCTMNLEPDQATILVNAIKSDYWAQMYLDDLPLWTNLGFLDKQKNSHIYTHFALKLTYNQNQIISARLQMGKPVQFYDFLYKRLSVRELKFSYSIEWQPTTINFSQRFQGYLEPEFFENNIHWFSILNSTVMVFLMCSIVVAIVNRLVKFDFDNYAAQELEVIEPTGWKQIAGDVFRAPPQLLILSVLVGNGWQLLFLMFLIMLVCLVHPVYQERGELTSLIIYGHIILGVVGGFKTSNHYAQFKGKFWIRTLFIGAWVVPGFIFAVESVLNSLAVMYQSSAAIPIGSILELGVLYSLLHFPLFFIGGILGRNYLTNPDFPVKPSPIKQPILKEKSWYSDPIFLISATGVLPFCSVSMELYFVFTSFWDYKFYYVYGFGLLALVLLALSVVSSIIVATYIFLNSEDYRWQWLSYAASSSVGGYVMVYSAYYFIAKSNMGGFFQLVFYFGYCFIMSTFIGLMAGALGYTGAFYFVKKIYYQSKYDQVSLSNICPFNINVLQKTTGILLALLRQIEIRIYIIDIRNCLQMKSLSMGKRNFQN